MEFGQIILLVLLLPGILIMLLVVAVVLPRALRDEKRTAANVCIKCGCALGNSTDQCPQCGAAVRH
jgi:hypothetical protein